MVQMKLPIVPSEIDGWNLRTLNKLLKIIKVESETLEFKGREFPSLTNLLCAMAFIWWLYHPGYRTR
jgi:hypothetical protein